MKAPHFSSSVKDLHDLSSVSDKSTNISKTKQLSEETTSNLLKWISQLTDKRRQFRKKYRCSNLLAETVLSNALKTVKRDLNKKQEEKRHKLKQFSYQLTVHTTPLASPPAGIYKSNEPASRDFLCKEPSPCAAEIDDAVKSSIQSLDKFFNGLSQVKV